MNGGPSGFSTYFFKFFLSKHAYIDQLNLNLLFFLVFLVGHVTDNAPVTRAFVIACALFTVFFGIQGRFNKLGLSYQVFFFLSVFSLFLKCEIAIGFLLFW